MAGEKLAWKRVIGRRVDARVVPSLSSMTALASRRPAGSLGASKRASTPPTASAVVDPMSVSPRRTSTLLPGANPAADSPTREPSR